MIQHVGLPSKRFDEVRDTIAEMALQFVLEGQEAGIIPKRRMAELAAIRAATAALQTGVTVALFAAHENGDTATAKALASWLPNDMRAG
jgi:hypothetical protein